MVHPANRCIGAKIACVVNGLTGIRCIPGYILLANQHDTYMLSARCYATELSTVYPDTKTSSTYRVFIVFFSRTLWGDNFGFCATCRVNGNPAWTCPAALSAYADIGGSDADILELDGGTGMRKRVSLGNMFTYGKACVDETWLELTSQQIGLRRGMVAKTHLVARTSTIGIQLAG